MPGVEQLTFIDLSLYSVIFLFVLGFIGGLVSGFIGSGGAFVLTPGMMTLGAPGAVAVASNMCHKFPKAMVGAYKRYKYGQVDLKLGVIMAISAAVGVLVGIRIQTFILNAWGEAGSNLYISLAFVVVLVVVGGGGGICLQGCPEVEEDRQGSRHHQTGPKAAKYQFAPHDSF